MFARIARGFSTPLGSFGYMSDNKLWGFAVIPLLLTLAIVVAMAFFVWVYLLGYISDKLAFDVLRDGGAFGTHIVSFSKNGDALTVTGAGGMAACAVDSVPRSQGPNHATPTRTTTPKPATQGHLDRAEGVCSVRTSASGHSLTASMSLPCSSLGPEVDWQLERFAAPPDQQPPSAHASGRRGLAKGPR